VLQHAWLQDTDFRQANLHESDMARVRIGSGVVFDGARTSRMRTLPRRSASPATI
jgi:Pentapeptide repeats (8 copies)